MSSVICNCQKGQPEGWACTRELGHPGACAVVDARGSTDFPPPVAAKSHLDDSIFEGFGGNWRWATIDYRGVARVHTFEPSFTATGRIEAPRFKANSEPREAFNVVDLPQGWQPLLIKRDMRKAGIRCVPTDRFGVNLPIGADPVEAADVKVDVHPLLGVVDVGQKYNIRRSEHCLCDISETQLEEIIARELGVQIDSTASFKLYLTGDGNGLTAEWKRVL